MRDTQINVIVRELGELFRNGKMFAGCAKKYFAQKSELRRFLLHSAEVWRLFPTDVTVFIGKDTSRKNEVIIWMPDRNSEILTEIAGVLAGMRCRVTIRKMDDICSIPAENVSKYSARELRLALQEVFRTPFPEG